MSELLTVLIQRDGMTEREAENEIREMNTRVMSGENPEEILLEYGLEPDYVFDIINF
ncbi:MAG: hypothetical protein IPO78_17250 [Saprospiraceae bacterium]|nr:hypothetical protein [Saprospiraceae bacterium]